MQTSTNTLVPYYSQKEIAMHFILSRGKQAKAFDGLSRARAATVSAAIEMEGTREDDPFIVAPLSGEQMEEVLMLDSFTQE